MNINELEHRTGITKQNIRFYEKKDLVHPVRNSVNNYREYTEEDVKTLKMIRLLRKIDLQLEDIRKILSEDASLNAIMEEHMNVLQKRRSELNACISFCKDLIGTEMNRLDVDGMLSKMDVVEKNGGRFMSIIQDYKRFAAAENLKHFSFKPDTMVMNSGEFTEALLQYAEENHLNLVLKKEGMNPVFEIDGREYKAYRAFDRFGATVHCSLTHPESVEVGGISQKRGRIYRFIHGPYLFMAGLVGIMAASRQSLGWALVVAVMIFPYLFFMFSMHRGIK